MWPMMSRMRAVTAGGATVQPTRSPVAAKAFEIPSTKIVYAAASGSVFFKQTSLGGNSVWLTSNSGDKYFYAHLDSFEGSSRGVSRGELIGYMGATGNANGTNHLHFEVHPGGGAAVNPYPYVRAAGC